MITRPDPEPDHRPPYCRLSADPLSIDEVVAAVSGPSQGAVVVFIGTVRDHNLGNQVVRLEYQAYAEMVHKMFRSIVRNCQRSADGVAVAIAHRTGQLSVGDAAVVLAASAPHRDEAFAAARQAIELLKADVPIWKKEYSPNGYEWVGMRP